MNLLQRKETLQAIGLIMISLQFLFVTGLNAQQENGATSRNRERLLQFAKVKAAAWERDRIRTDSLAERLQLPFRYQELNNRMVTLQRLGYHNRPLYYATDNANAAQIISVDQLWTGGDGLPSLTGEGIEINLWDGGAVLDTHREFTENENSRIVLRDLDIPLSNHSTHVAGTMAAAGYDENAKGMAGMAKVYGWDFSNDITEMAFVALEGILVSNHSYGPLCGWYYNSTSESWYWYGDPDVSNEEDYQFGFYDEVSADMDYIAWCAPRYLIVKSAGNDRNDTPEEQPIAHLVWDESWVSVIAERDPDGGKDGYDCLTPMAVPKNILTVGAVDDDRNISSFSAFGPTDDGRIKPDVVANGTDVYSTIASSDHSYDHISGTSMSTASATGSISLLHQLQQSLQPGVNLLSSTLKGLLIHTAEDVGTNIGPDFQYGWGILNIKMAADLMQLNYGNGGQNIYEGNINEGETLTIPVQIEAPSIGIKATLCWTDPPGEISEPELNPKDEKLVNDLDLELILPGDQPSCFPWILNASHPEEPATQGVNHVDNVEQLFLPDPATGIYQIKIAHSGTLADGNQAYSLIISGISTPSEILPPRLLQFNAGYSSVTLKWTSAKPGLPAFYRIYRNDVLLAETADTTYLDEGVETENEYDYYTTAVYDLGGDYVESVATNTVTAIPRALRVLPVFIDFEEGHADVIIKNSYDGWRWGDSESLSCYYLRFQENTTQFVGIDSYSTGETSHVHDVASTLPLKLAGNSDVTISFDYMFITDIYNAIDELYVVYKKQEEAEWHKLEQIPMALNWTHYTLSFPDELCMNGMQIGIYYDDLYQWGMGAGLDNISIVGEASRSIDMAITSMISPVSACTLSDAEPVSITILNAGLEDVLPGDNMVLQLNLAPDIQMEEQVVLTEVLQSGESLVYQMGTTVDLSKTGSYSFSFLLSSDLDNNVLNNSLSSVIEVTGNPQPTILNQDLSFCEDDPPVLIEVSPEGGVLSGTGIYGLYFDPNSAGAGTHLITYTFTDPSGCEGSITAEIVVIAVPQPSILNQDLTCCEEDPPILIEVSPEGGILTGPGVDGFYLDPMAAGAGLQPITYTYTDSYGCTGRTYRQLRINKNPWVNLGPDLQLGLDDTVVLEPDGNGATFLWYNGSVNKSLSLITNELGTGEHDIWVETTSTEQCIAIDSILLIIDQTIGTGPQLGPENPIIYPNPFHNGFHLKLNQGELVEHILILGPAGQVLMNTIPTSFPYFDVSKLPAGPFILKVQTRAHTYVLKIIKTE